MTVMAYEERDAKVFRDEEKVRAEITIDMRASFLERIYIELFGQDVKTGERRYEKIVPR